MQAQVIWFRPGSGRGVARSESGREWPIALQDDHLHLQGGDVIEFDPQRRDGGSPASDVRLVERGGMRLLREQSQLVKEFLESIRSIH